MNRFGRQLVVGLCGALVAVGFSYGAGPKAIVLAAGTPNISLTEIAPATVLYGNNATVTLTAANPAAGSWGYNLSFEDVLPSGVSYVAGSGSLGGPTILTNQPSANKTTLIWNNVADLSPGSSEVLTFKLAAATDVDPAPFLLPNNSYTDSASAYVNSAPQQVPQFSASGVASNYTGSATASGTTALSPLQISLAPGGVLLRGVHDHQVVYTVTITNNDVHATNTKQSSFATDEATVNTRTSEVVGGAPLSSQTQVGNLRSNRFNVYDKGDRVVFKGGVHARLNQH